MSELPGFLQQFPNDRIFAILDRDFREDGLVERGYAPNYPGHLFVWRRFTIENYLLEPAGVAEAIEEFYMHQPERISEALRSAETVEQFLLGWCRRLAPQVAGSWVISDLNREARGRGLSVEARRYFEDLTQRDSAWVLAELIRHYDGWRMAHPDLFNEGAAKARFEDRLNRVSAKAQTLSGAHQVVSGKVIMKALYAELPEGPKPGKEYVRNRPVRLASKQVPEDIRILVEERIIPRWRRMRSGGLTGT